MPRRTEQVNSLLQEQIGRFLLSNFETPSGVLVTITRVVATPDLRQAKVYISVLPENNRGSILEGLRKVTSEIRRSLYRDMETHSVPNLIFAIDDTEARAVSMEELLDSISDVS